MAIVEIIFDKKDSQWLIDHAADVLDLNEIIYRYDGKYAFGDDATPVSGLVWYGGISAGSFATLSGAARDNDDLRTELEAIDSAFDALDLQIDAINDELDIHDQVLQVLATEVAKKKNRPSELDSGGAITIGTYGGSGTNNDVRIAPAVWYIVSTFSLYETLVNSDFLDIAPAASGLQRYDGYFGTTSGTIVKVIGDEGVSATPPTTPTDTAPIGYVLVNDAGISASEPAPDIYALRSEEDASGGHVGLTLFKINFKNALGTIISHFTNSNTATRTYTFPDATDTIVLRDFIQTLTNKRITRRVVSITSSSTPTPDIDVTDQYNVTALGVAATFGAPTGTPTAGQLLLIRIKDNSIARTLSFNAAYRFSSELSAPATTTASKTLYLGFVYHATDAKWDCIFWINNFG